MAEALARALVRVRGMRGDEARSRVMETLLNVRGVVRVAPGDSERFSVEYDPTETTVMDLIRALRRIGFLAGME